MRQGGNFKMLLYVNSNLFDSPAQVLVNTVNTVGVMGKGIALQFKKLYPDMFTHYQKFCENGSLTVGKLYIYKTSSKWILNFPTKKSWRNKSKIEYIEAGLKKFVETYRERGIESISFPQLGAGNGGLDWDKEVKPLMEKYLKPLPIKIYIHIYSGWERKPEYKNVKEMRQWIESEPTSLSLGEFKHDFKLAQGAVDFYEDEHHVEIVDNDEIDETLSDFMVVSLPDQRSYALTQSDISDFWTRLRDQGIMLDVDFPRVILSHYDNGFFKKLMVKLAYIELIPVSLGETQIFALTFKKRLASEGGLVSHEVNSRTLLEG